MIVTLGREAFVNKTKKLKNYSNYVLYEDIIRLNIFENLCSRLLEEVYLECNKKGMDVRKTKADER